jgi:hypothetical protein
MTRTELVAAARVEADMVGDTKFSDANFVRFLNSAVGNIQNFLLRTNDNLLVKKVTFTATTASRYLLTSAGIIPDNDFLKPYYLRYSNSPTPIPTIDFTKISDSVRPSYYILDGYLDFYEAPAVGQGYIFYYIKSITRFTNTTESATPPIVDETPTWLPEHFQDLLVFYAAIRALEIDRQDATSVKNNYAVLFNEYERYIESLRGENTMSSENQYGIKTFETMSKL